MKMGSVGRYGLFVLCRCYVQSVNQDWVPLAGWGINVRVDSGSTPPSKSTRGK